MGIIALKIANLRHPYSRNPETLLQGVIEIPDMTIGSPAQIRIHRVFEDGRTARETKNYAEILENYPSGYIRFLELQFYHTSTTFNYEVWRGTKHTKPMARVEGDAHPFEVVHDEFEEGVE